MDEARKASRKMTQVIKPAVDFFTGFAHMPINQATFGPFRLAHAVALIDGYMGLVCSAIHFFKCSCSEQ